MLMQKKNCIEAEMLKNLELKMNGCRMAEKSEEMRCRKSEKT